MKSYTESLFRDNHGVLPLIIEEEIHTHLTDIMTLLHKILDDLNRLQGIYGEDLFSCWIEQKLGMRWFTEQEFMRVVTESVRPVAQAQFQKRSKA